MDILFQEFQSKLKTLDTYIWINSPLMALMGLIGSVTFLDMQQGVKETTLVDVTVVYIFEKQYGYLPTL